MRQKILVILAALAFVTAGASAATYPYTAAEITGPEIVTGTCAAWGLTEAVGASSCDTVTITRTASASDLVLTNTGTVGLGRTYTTSLTITRTAGSLTLDVGGVSGTARATSDTFTQDFTTTADSAVTITFDADFAGTITTTVSVKRIKGSSQYTPTAVTTPATAPDYGGVIPEDAIEATLSVETNPIRYRYNADPTASVGVLLPAGAVLRWGPEDIAKFKAIRFIDTAAGAAVVNIEYAKGYE